MLFVCLIFSVNSYASCKLPPKEVLTVACTDKCKGWVSRSVEKAARKLKYKVRFKELNAEKTVAAHDIDALIMPGGVDIHPKYYMNEVDHTLRDYIQENLHLAKLTKDGERRDPFEFKLAKEYFEDESWKETPFLGICRGMQMMTVAHKVPLYLDIKTEIGIRNRRWVLDRVHAKAGSMISQVRKKRRFLGVKNHHQGLRVPYYHLNQARFPNLKVTAHSNQGLIAEAIEFKNRPHALGVQYHPEYTFGKTRRSHFKWLLTKACELKK